MKKITLFVAAAMTALTMNAQKSAYLMLESSISNLPEEYSEVVEGEQVAENPEQNAANWYNAQFVNKNNGVLLPVADIDNAIAQGINTIWVNIDRVGLASIADAGVSDAVIADLKEFVEAGGNLLLTKQACMIAHRISRIYEPTYGCVGYGLGGDVWSINPQVGLWWTLAESRRDNSEHPIYADMDTVMQFSTVMSEDAEPTLYPTYPLIGAVARTDNNIGWIDYFRKDLSSPDMKLSPEDENAHYANDNPLRLPDFENDWNVQVLGIWGHVADFCGGVIVDMNPDGNYKGRILAIGASAYQWGASNDYISNVKKLTKNSINYVVADNHITFTALEEVEANAVRAGIYDVLGHKVENMVPGQLYIVNGKKMIR